MKLSMTNTVREHPLAVSAGMFLLVALLLLVHGTAHAQAITEVSVQAVAQASAPTRRTARPHRVLHGDMAAESDTARTTTFNREVFSYDPAGRRDPFVSLIKSSEIRPVISDLRLTAVAFDPTGQNSVAVLRDLNTKEQYRVKVGSTLGRMRVVRIDTKMVTFALEEFGFSRQATLAMGDSTHTRTP
jgi:hypothetical protein